MLQDLYIRDKLHNSLNLCLFSGAGISYSFPGNNPLSDHIVNSMIQLLCSIAFSEDKNIRTRTENLYCEISNTQIRLEVLFDILKRILGEKVLNCFSDMNCQYPNLDHLYIAKLCEIRKIKNIFTLNFDLLHERSFDLLGIDYQSFDSISAQNKTTLGENEHNIYHLHGTNQNLQNLSIGVMDVGSAMDKNKINPLIKSISTEDIFCFGYSDNDPDTFPIIANSLNRIFWYLFEPSQKIPNNVFELNNQKPNFYFIERISPEKSFHESLINIFPELKNYSDEIIYRYNQYCNIEHKTSMERLNLYCKKVKNLLSNEDESDTNIAKFVLGCILFNKHKFSSALDLFTEIKPNNSLSNLSYYTKQAIAGIYEFSGNPKDSYKYWSLAYRIFKKSNISDFNERSKVRLAKVRLMIWKRNNGQIQHLIMGFLSLIQMARSQKPDIYTISYLSIAEFFHFLSEYFPFILLDKLFPKNIQLKMNKVKCKTKGILFSYLESSKLRFFLLSLAGKYYGLLVRDNRTNNYQYQFLAQLRLYEIHAALSTYSNSILKKYTDKIYYTKFEIDSINKYYQWANINDGICNYYYTLAILEYYKNHYENALRLFFEVKDKYKLAGMDSGVIKCNLFVERLILSNSKKQF